MSQRRPWPEGVPELPPFPRVGAVVFERWCEVGDQSDSWTMDYWAERSVDDVDECRERADENTKPSVVMLPHGQIAYANAAARALGIVPDGEADA